MSNRFEDTDKSNHLTINKKSKGVIKYKKRNKNMKLNHKFINDIEHNLLKSSDNTLSSMKKLDNQVINNIPNPMNTISNLDDLLKLAKMAKEKETNNVQYIKSVQRLSKIVEPLEELNNVIGLDYIKNQLIDQVIYLMTHCDERYPPMLHTIIDGPPGTGKTKIAKIIGKIISKIGYLKPLEKIDNSPKFTSMAKLIKDSLVIDIIPEKMKTNKNGIVKYVTRNDLVSGYLGQTAIKTQKAIDEASGGVLIIDEAYSLGGKRGHDDTDSYSQECIDTLVSNLSENRSFVCIILGYSDDINNSFISQNKGLESRFPFRYTIKDYQIEDLYNILTDKITNDGYNYNKEIFQNFLLKKSKEFKFMGRDMETLWFKIKMAHTKRIFLKKVDNTNEIIKEDIDEGLNKFFSIRNINKEKEKNPYYAFYT
ncbi:putative ATPase [Cafeteria roenbergensis virus]|uniref:Putative ATPase n=1 Tax=Cafeteria roenbergensis virus (strain BV-PW1) TaxID=693272 RepID=E3T549_CROVB|nr:putative ATPase [Cafeteria roenbergensis virus BV-PW1]ADO67312.1 putative ATPase [Cafeteria roenbergensis virus BV-PW1]